MKMSLKGLSAWIAIAAAGCGSAGKQIPPQAPAPAPPFTATRSGDRTLINNALKPLIDTAVADLARRLNTDPAQITVLEARSVVWPDGGLGCPRPGMIYPQVQQDGALIRLRAQGRDFAYHSGGSRPIFLCEGGS
jgi:hypothetical protein